MILALFDSVQRAASALDALLDSGAPPSELGLAMTDRAAERAFGRPEARDGEGATRVFGAEVHALAAALRPLAALGTVGTGLVASGPLAALLVSAGLGSRGGLGQALAELGITADAAEVVQRVTQGGVLVAISGAGASDAPPALARDSALFWRVPPSLPLTRAAVVTEPLAPAPERSGKYRPVIESPDAAGRSSLDKHGR